MQNVWEGFPPRLQYNPNHFGVATPYLSFRHILVYLDYLDLNFRIQRLLSEILGDNNDQDLLTVALALMNTSSNCIKRFCRRFGASKDWDSILWIYGLPSAIVLANALWKRAQLGQEISHPIPRAELYRQLSVLASDVEANADPSEGNFPIYNEQRKLLSEKLDLAFNAYLERSYYNPLDLSAGDMGLFTAVAEDYFPDHLADMDVESQGLGRD